MSARSKKKTAVRERGECEIAVEMVKSAMRDDAENEVEISLHDRVSCILATCFAHATATKSVHLRKVAFTIGVLRAVRFIMRDLNQGKTSWTGSPEVFASIGETSLMITHEAIEGIASEMGMKKSHATWASYRKDLRFSLPFHGKELVPFTPRFPRFEPADIDREVYERILNDVAEMSFIGRKEIVSGDPRANEIACENLVMLIVILVSIGRCALSLWMPEEGRFLDMLACIDADLSYDSKEKWMN